MMVIDIRKLNAQKKYSGDMEFTYSAPETLIEIPFVKFAGPVKVAFAYDLYEDDSLEIRGIVSYRLEGQCSRCLKDAAQFVETMDTRTSKSKTKRQAPIYPFKTKSAKQLSSAKMIAVVLRPLRQAFLAAKISGVSAVI